METDLDGVIRRALNTSQARCIGDVTGGIVNAGNAKIYEVDDGKVFVKFNLTPQGREMFECEESSLLDISKTNTVRVPRPYKVVSGPGKGGTTLICEYLPNLQPIKDDETWTRLGTQIGCLHNYNPGLLVKDDLDASRITGKASLSDPGGVSTFGYHKAHYFGPEFHVPADTWTDTWEEYLSRHLFDRLIRACEERFGDRELSEGWATLSLKLHKPFQNVNIKPSLLHGDLFDISIGQVDGEPVVFDPQCWYGHAEFEDGEELPENYHTGYSSVTTLVPPGSQLRGKIYTLFVNILLYYCQVEIEENRSKALGLMHSLNEEL